MRPVDSLVLVALYCAGAVHAVPAMEETAAAVTPPSTAAAVTPPSTAAAVTPPSTVVNATPSSTRSVSIEDKQVAEAASAAADKVVAKLEVARDEAWQNARGSLAVASNPPIRSSRVYEMLSAETDRFAQLEDAINNAKANSVHKRRVAELTGAAWDAHESLRLKKLRASASVLALEQAKEAAEQARVLEQELLHELATEAGHQLSVGSA